MFSFKGWDAWRESFLSKCYYVAGQYNSAEDFKKLHNEMVKVEQKYSKAHRVFYFAIPPSIFVEVASAVKQSASSTVMLSTFLL